MSADGSPNSAPNGPNRYQRAGMEALRAVTDDGRVHQVSERSTSNLKTKNVIPTDLKRPRRAGNSKIDEVLAAIGGGAANGQGEGDHRGEDPGRPSDRDRTSRTTIDRDDDARREAKSSSPLDSEAQRRAFDLEPDDEGEEDAPRRKRRGKTLQAFAEEHEVQPEAIYGLEVHLEEGSEPVTIGALKDSYKERRGFEQIRDDFEDYRSQAQTEIIQGRNQINRMVQLVAGSLPPSTLQRIGQELETESRAALDQNRRMLREYYPEWEAPAAANAARKRMLEVVTQYGFSDVEFMNVTDARLIRLLWDAIRKADRYDALRKGIREEKQRPKEPPAQRKHRPSVNDHAKRLAKGGDTIGAIATLIGE